MPRGDEGMAVRILARIAHRIWPSGPVDAVSVIDDSPEPTMTENPHEFESQASEPESLAEFVTLADSVLEPPPGPGPARLEIRALWVPKRGNTEAQWEDGFAVDAPTGLLTLADGASDGVFTRLWVELLLTSFLARPLPLDDLEAVEAWLSDQRREWFRAICYPELRWSLQRRVDTSCAAATFLAFRLDPDGPGWTSWAVGDVCLLHVRQGRLIRSFPVERSCDFGYTPPLYQSKPLRPIPEAQVLRGEIQPGDLLLLVTDALAQCLLAQIESGESPNWWRLLTIDEDTWRQDIEKLRDRGAIVNDDCTMLVVQLPSEDPDATGAGAMARECVPETVPAESPEPSLFAPVSPHTGAP